MTHCCNHPKTLTGIETQTAWRASQSWTSCNHPKTLTGIETHKSPDHCPCLALMAATTPKPLQGLKRAFPVCQKSCQESHAATTPKPLQGLKQRQKGMQAQQHRAAYRCNVSAIAASSCNVLQPCTSPVGSSRPAGSVVFSRCLRHLFE